MSQESKGRSRGGIVSFVLGLLAAAMIVVGLVVSWRAPLQLGGLHWLLIGPAVLLINLVGGFLAATAIARRTRLKWALTGMVMNCVPGLCMLGLVLLTYFAGPPPQAPLYTLPSGKQIRITGVGPGYFSSGPPALIMNCETDISIDDKAELRKEVDEIWEIFRKDVENAHMTIGVIRMVHNESTGIVTHAKGYGFVFEKRADGRWRCLDDDKK
jgi:hypothetical protein